MGCVPLVALDPTHPNQGAVFRALHLLVVRRLPNAFLRDIVKFFNDRNSHELAREFRARVLIEVNLFEVDSDLVHRHIAALGLLHLALAKHLAHRLPFCLRGLTRTYHCLNCSRSIVMLVLK